MSAAQKAAGMMIRLMIRSQRRRQTLALGL